jgi:hypothetical protein
MVFDQNLLFHQQYLRRYGGEITNRMKGVPSFAAIDQRIIIARLLPK